MRRVNRYLIVSTGSTPNERLFAGEQFDANAGFYYLRARYMNPDTGRFWSIDSYGGNQYDPVSLHKYLYANANPVTNVDPSGHSSIVDATFTCALVGALAGGLYGGLKAGLKTGWDPRAIIYGTLAGAMIGFIALYIVVYGGTFIAIAFGVPLITGIQVAGGLMFAYATQQQLNALQAAETDEERLAIIIELVVSCGLMAWGVSQMYDPEVTMPARDGPYTPLTPGGGLQAHENAGGHLLGKHVNQSVEAVAARFQVETKIPAASTFTDRMTAETAVTAALDSNESQISTWLNSSTSKVLRINYTSSTPVGVTLQRGASSPTGLWNAGYSSKRFESASEVLHTYGISGMSQTRFYELGQLLGAYFHQDWTLMNSDATAVIRSIIEENTRAKLTRAAAEIDELLALRLSEDELARLFYPKLGIYYVPPADGLSYSDWLQSVHNAFLVDEKEGE